VWSGFQQDPAKRLGDVKRNSFRDALLMLAVAMPLAACGHAGLLDDGGLAGADLGADRSGKWRSALPAAMPTWPGSSALAMNWHSGRWA
jgi:hypothetical protein